MINDRCPMINDKFLDLRHAALGRRFVPEEAREPAGHPAARLSHGLWERRFGADRSIIGRSLGINAVTLTIVGVLPADFRGVSGRADLWVTSVMAQLRTYADY